MTTIADLIQELKQFDGITTGEGRDVLDVVYAWDRKRKTEYKQKMLVQNVDDFNLILPFGKYKGRKLDDILTFDRKYLIWVSKQEFFNQKNYPNLHRTLSANLSV